MDISTMKNVFVVADNLCTPLGHHTALNFERLEKGFSGIKLHDNLHISHVPFHASIFDKNDFGTNEIYTKFEQLLIQSVEEALTHSDIKLSNPKTILVISSTKGNVFLLEKNEYNSELKKRIALSTSATLVANYFKCANRPVVVSNACISGVMAIVTAQRLLESGQYENAVVVGSDVITKFILSGFQAFQAVSEAPCKPFDATRNGISLGEGAATVVLSVHQQTQNDVKVAGGAISNDANHISGPSRTGDGLAIAITNTLKNANVLAKDVHFVSAHGTATIFNDEMEANALYLTDLQNVPVNSLKPFYGHTLGAAGLIETVVTINALKKNILLPTLGFKEMGVTKPINVINKLQTQPLHNCLKIASGFGGCNAALLVSKN